MEYLIPRGAIVYLDTNPIIYLTEGNAAFKDSSQPLQGHGSRRRAPHRQ